MTIDIPEWVAPLLALLIPSPLALLKGARVSIIPAIKAIIAIVSVSVIVAEDVLGPGTGAEKKAAVIKDIQEKLPGLAEQLQIPGWVVTLLTSEGVLGFVIDIVVSGANSSGLLKVDPPAVAG